MPFTPFHMGAVLIVKPRLEHRISLIAFGLAQIAMDVEPGVRMLFGWDDVLHGPSHSFLGALLIALLVLPIVPRVADPILRRWNKEVAAYGQAWLIQPDAVSRRAAIAGALFGTLSHVVLDSLMHHDMKPLFPFSSQNLLLGLVSHDAVYQLCAVAACWGATSWLITQRRGGRSSPGGNAVIDPSPKDASYWESWGWELRTTWLGLLLVAALPTALWGTVIFAYAALAVVMLFSLNQVMLGAFTRKGSTRRAWREAAVGTLVCLMVLTFAASIDKKIPSNAAPIVAAIESFHAKEGQFPETLNELEPRYLAQIPKVRGTIEQPKIAYRLTNGKPHLSIPSTMGDAFAAHEYDFDAKTWVHYD